MTDAASKPKPKKEKIDPSVAQAMASDPGASVWVTASAGTGKTKVLTDRVLRLMLDGAKPGSILCLTFTNAAASLMKNRIREELSNWATCKEDVLKTKLRKLTGGKADDLTVRRARQLYAEFLEASENVQIQTIHSFAGKLLRRFPIESGVPPYFEVMDDQTATEFFRASQVDVLNLIRKEPDGALARAVRMITPEVGEEDFVALIGEITYRRSQLRETFDLHGGLEKTIDAIHGYLKTGRGTDAKAVRDRLFSDEGIDGQKPDTEALRAAATALLNGSDADRKKGRLLSRFLDNPADRVPLYNDYIDLFLTEEDSIRKRLASKEAADALPALASEAQRVFDGLEKVKTVNLARGTESLMVLSDALLAAYKKRKQAQNVLDYDDLIHKANNLLAEEDMTSWVLHKLDHGVEHILIDEGQDTNPEQWQVVAQIASELFSEKYGKKRSQRTVFVVGDEKQSIFSFQRADPREFNAHKEYFSDLVRKAGGKWREVEIDVTFRSSPAVMTVVDKVFEDEKASDGLFFVKPGEGESLPKIRHKPFRAGQSGLVESHPVLEVDAVEETVPWELPLERKTVRNPAAEMAAKIADQIKDWLDRGEKLPARDRAINPSDIMILVRRRSEFVDHMVRELKKRDIPVAGSDRMSLSSQLAVMDFVALGEFTLFPGDDLKMAAVLKSPFVGFDDKQLEDIAIGRSGTLWDSLKTKAAAPGAPKLYTETVAWFEKLQKKRESERPYEFFADIMMNKCPGHEWSGLTALYSRLGYEIEDPLVEFMNALERFEKTHTPSLQGFIDWLQAGEAEVKREINIDPKNPRVHIMTVHGAKGLESPIIILPDTTGIPSDNRLTRPKLLWPEGERKVPLWVPRVGLEPRSFSEERAKAEKDRDREYRRLLYVAMTRAADRLYVYGYQGARKRSPDCWYDLIRGGLERLDGQTPGTHPADAVLRYKVDQTAKPQPDGMKPPRKRMRVGVPDWARKKPEQPNIFIKKFYPSIGSGGANDNFPVPSPLEGLHETKAQRTGILIHDLLEFLPAVPESEREGAAKHYLARPVWKLDEKEQQRLAGQVMKVLGDPEFSEIFGSNSRPEVAVTGKVVKNGEERILSGKIDRLVVGEKSVLIVDYKNSWRIPKAPEEISETYLIQMAAYRQAIQQIYPDKEVKCAFLWTRKAQLTQVTGEMLDKVCQKIDLKPAPKTPPPAGPKP